MSFAKKAGLSSRLPVVAILALSALSLTLSPVGGAKAAPAGKSQGGAHARASGEGHSPAKEPPQQEVNMPPPGMFAPPPGEITRFDGWSVTCLPQAKAGAPGTCMAKMEIIKSKEDPRPILIINMIKSGGATTFVLQTPTAVDLGPGVSVKFGEAAPRKLNYVSCEPALCTSAVLLDDPLAQELSSAPRARVAWMGLGRGEVSVEFEPKDAKRVIEFLKVH